ncbi:amino acid transporter [Elasticomyces elasticus]|nr:amino acid transporter [Elasticomyces elasticus]KAK4989310.1 amino acid transporter [Elasticomyces elasticus]
MAIWNRAPSETKTQDAQEIKTTYSDGSDGLESPAYEYGEGEGHPAGHTALHKGLGSRQITMIAIGGALGTGLIIGTGKALAQAGPASILISYTLIGMLVFLVMCALGEMAAWIPEPGGFVPYATRYVDPALGFALGYTYWFKYLITTPNQLTAAALVIQYWVPANKVNPGVFIAVFLVSIIAINYLGIKFFGELEFVLSSAKVLVIVGLIILSLVLALGGGPDHDRKGFRYWKEPGAFAPYIATGALGNFLGLWSSMITAVFAYLGIELVGVTVGETKNPRKNIPAAIKLTFYRILFFYVLSVLFLGMLVPYNSPKLLGANKKSNSASASPFVLAISLAGIKGLPGFINGCILLFVFSASNSDLYIASRTIHGLALRGQAPAFLARTNKAGVPIYSLGISAAVACIAFLNCADSSKAVFNYLINLVTIFGLLSWISILVSHICFVKARKAQGVPLADVPYRAPLGIWGSYVALFFCCLIALTKNFSVFTRSPKTYGAFDYKNFVTGYLGIPLYLILIFGWKVGMKSKRVKASKADLFGGKAVIDREQREADALDAEKLDGKGWFYRRFVAWLF